MISLHINRKVFDNAMLTFLILKTWKSNAQSPLVKMCSAGGNGAPTSKVMKCVIMLPEFPKQTDTGFFLFSQPIDIKDPDSII